MSCHATDLVACADLFFSTCGRIAIGSMRCGLLLQIQRGLSLSLCVTSRTDWDAVQHVDRGG